MSRAPYQVLVIPYHIANSEIKFAVFKRADSSQWQFVAGGGEDQEDPLSAAKREAYEEAAISAGEWICLESQTSIPRKHFPKALHWDSGILVIPEYSFAVKVESKETVLSQEHCDLRWLSEKEASQILTFDSNRVALWELTQRI